MRPRPRLRLTVLATGVAYVAIGVLLLFGRSGPALALSNLALGRPVVRAGSPATSLTGVAAGGVIAPKPTPR